MPVKIAHREACTRDCVDGPGYVGELLYPLALYRPDPQYPHPRSPRGSLPLLGPSQLEPLPRHYPTKHDDGAPGA
jgi:hypothetical protein